MYRVINAKWNILNWFDRHFQLFLAACTFLNHLLNQFAFLFLLIVSSIWYSGIIQKSQSAKNLWLLMTNKIQNSLYRYAKLFSLHCFPELCEVNTSERDSNKSRRLWEVYWLIFWIHVKINNKKRVIFAYLFYHNQSKKTKNFVLNQVDLLNSWNMTSVIKNKLLKIITCLQMELHGIQCTQKQRITNKNKIETHE